MPNLTAVFFACLVFISPEAAFADDGQDDTQSQDAAGSERERVLRSDPEWDANMMQRYPGMTREGAQDYRRDTWDRALEEQERQEAAEKMNLFNNVPGGREEFASYVEASEKTAEAFESEIKRWRDDVMQAMPNIRSEFAAEEGRITETLGQLAMAIGEANTWKQNARFMKGMIDNPALRSKDVNDFIHASSSRSTKLCEELSGAIKTFRKTGKKGSPKDRNGKQSTVLSFGSQNCDELTYLPK